jgi:NAD(P)-dependent dehydrogenase (short-subunit alcohol dehydrogenase family)
MRGGIVVTGASTGIGAAIADRLSAASYLVFGTVRRPDDAAALERIGAVAVRMDVTDGESIRAARNKIERQLGTEPLVGVVNNAGIAAAGPLEHLPLDELRRVLEVNVVGLVGVTQAFLPALRRSRGCVINIGSVSGRVAMPFSGPYAASKSAVEAISDSLRRELLPSGIRVVLIQSGSINTPLWDKVDRMDLDQYRETAYATLLPIVRERAVKSGQHSLPADRVAAAVLTALTASRPPTRMLVVRRPLATRLLRVLPDRWVDRRVAKALGNA